MSTGKRGSAGAQDRVSLESAIEKINKQVKELRNFDLTGIQERWDQRVEGLQRRVNIVLSDALGMGTPEYKQHSIRALDAALDTTFGDRYTLDELKQGLKQGINQAVGNLNAVKTLLAERLEALTAAPGTKPAPPPTPAPTPAVTSAVTPTPAEATAIAPAPTPAATPATTSASMPMSTPTPIPTPMSNPESASEAAGRSIAIVCRLDEATGKAASAFVEQLGLAPLMVQNSAAHGQGNFIDRLDEVRGADYVIVLLQAADLGAAPGDSGVRPEVLLETGFLFGAVGRRRVCFLLAGKSSLGPDLDAVTIRHAMDEAGLWRLLLAREMKQSGLDVDMNRAL